MSGPDKSLAHQPETLESILDSIGDGVVVADQQGRFLVWNPAAEHILNMGPDNSAPDQWASHYGLFLADGKTPFPTDQLPLVRAIRGESVDTQEIFVRHERIPDGIWLSVTARPLRDAQGRVHGGVSVFRNITADKQAAQEREKLIVQLQEALAHVRTLSGLLPICASCKRIRDDTGKWSPLESFLVERSEVEFTHGVCPQCWKTMYKSR